MIDLYTWPTPNGQKLHIMIEETGLPCRLHPVDITAGEQFAPEFLAISPNNKIPAMIDQDGPDGKPLALFESGAMLIYLAEKSGRLLPCDPRPRMQVLQWLMFQMASVGPMLGQANYFRKYAPEPVPAAIERYTREAGRLYGVIDRRLGESAYLGGGHYSIADIATLPWVLNPEEQGVDPAGLGHYRRWRDLLLERPAVQRGLAVLADRQRDPADATARAVLFGDQQYRQGRS
ncbi:MAG: glutathione S-transferase family protein [Gammaproteobacteria bacterium]|nr:MAG: glutathione S-transferase family protein [Gammaproteobacteria bacterium]